MLRSAQTPVLSSPDSKPLWPRCAVAGILGTASALRPEPRRDGDPMIDRQGNRILIECDSCSEVFEGHEDASFQEAWADAKREGWRTRKIADVWLHGCPDCGAPT